MSNTRSNVKDSHRCTVERKRPDPTEHVLKTHVCVYSYKAERTDTFNVRIVIVPGMVRLSFLTHLLLSLFMPYVVQLMELHHPDMCCTECISST